MKKSFVAAAYLAVPLTLAAQTPTPVKTPGPAAGTFDAGKSHTGVRTQQGKVQTDADWNERLETCKRQNEALKKKMKVRANELEIQLRQLEAAANKPEENKKNTQDHNKAVKDSIRKMLDQIAEINRAANL